MLLVSAECAEVISAIPMLIWNEKQAAKREDVLKTDTTYDDVADMVRYLIYSKLSPKERAPREIRAREVLESAEARGAGPNEKAMAMRVFDAQEAQRGRIISRPRWRV